MNLKIRLMKKTDLDNLSRMYVKVYTAFNVGESWNSASAKKLLVDWLSRQPDLSFVAEVDGKLAGAFVAGIRPWWDGNHLVDGEVFVDPDCQKSGIGTELSKALYKKALKKYDVVAFDTYTFKKSKFPLSWYIKSQGFKVNEDWVMIAGNVKLALAKLQKK